MNIKSFKCLIEIDRMNLESLTNSLLSLPQIMGIKAHFLFTRFVISPEKRILNDFLEHLSYVGI